MIIPWQFAEIGEAAVELAADGLYVFPIEHRGKHPLVRWGTSEPASCAPTVVAGWWTRWPAAGIGMACKPSRIVVVDLDGPVGEASWSELTAGIES